MAHPTCLLVLLLLLGAASAPPSYLITPAWPGSSCGSGSAMVTVSLTGQCTTDAVAGTSSFDDCFDTTRTSISYDGVNCTGNVLTNSTGSLGVCYSNDPVSVSMSCHTGTTPPAYDGLTYSMFSGASTCPPTTQTLTTAYTSPLGCFTTTPFNSTFTSVDSSMAHQSTFETANCAGPRSSSNSIPLGCYPNGADGVFVVSVQYPSPTPSPPPPSYIAWQSWHGATCGEGDVVSSGSYSVGPLGVCVASTSAIESSYSQCTSGMFTKAVYNSIDCTGPVRGSNESTVLGVCEVAAPIASMSTCHSSEPATAVGFSVGEYLGDLTCPITTQELMYSETYAAGVCIPDPYVYCGPTESPCFTTNSSTLVSLTPSGAGINVSRWAVADCSGSAVMSREYNLGCNSSVYPFQSGPVVFSYTAAPSSSSSHVGAIVGGVVGGVVGLALLILVVACCCCRKPAAPAATPLASKQTGGAPAQPPAPAPVAGQADAKATFNPMQTVV